MVLIITKKHDSNRIRNIKMELFGLLFKNYIYKIIMQLAVDDGPQHVYLRNI